MESSGLSSLEPALKQEWEEFKIKFSKTYESEEEESKRLNIYLESKKMVATHNEKFQKGEVSWQMGINQFSDMESKEYAGQMCGLKKPPSTQV